MTVHDAAERLMRAAETGVPCEPVRDLIGTDISMAYDVQRAVIAHRGGVVVGRKIGLTSHAVQQQLGVDEPDFGVLLDDMDYTGRDVPMSRLLQPKAEAELAFVLADDLTVASTHVALEIVDSRIAGWDITYADTVADNASSGLFVLGPAIGVEPRLAEMTMSLNGQVVSTGNGEACLGDPLNALRWLADTARAFGDPLRPGQIVLSGALGPMVSVTAGDIVETTISGTTFTVRFTQEGIMTKVAVIGSGNIGTDLMIKVLRLSDTLEMAAMVGIDPDSDGLARAARLGVPTTAKGIDGLIAMPGFDEIEIVFDATSAGAHKANAAKLAPYGKTLVDLTPAAIGPFVVPAVNLDEHRGATNVNMVTCGGQATIPVVAAISRVVDVAYAEIVASIASKSAGPGTRANIDEFTETTSHAIEQVGGAARGKAIIILNPAEPPMIMRDTVLALIDDPVESRQDEIRASVERMVADVAAYVPGYRLKQDVQFKRVPADAPMHTLAGDAPISHQVSVFLEVEGAAHYLPAYAGNLDIMTSAALRVGEELAR